MIQQELTLRTRSTAVLKVGDLKELIAAMHRHNFKDNDMIVVEISPSSTEHSTYFSLVATQVQEPGS